MLSQNTAQFPTFLTALFAQQRKVYAFQYDILLSHKLAQLANNFIILNKTIIVNNNADIIIVVTNMIALCFLDLRLFPF